MNFFSRNLLLRDFRDIINSWSSVTETRRRGSTPNVERRLSSNDDIFDETEFNHRRRNSTVTDGSEYEPRRRFSSINIDQRRRYSTFGVDPRRRVSVTDDQELIISLNIIHQPVLAICSLRKNVLGVITLDR
jgi:hypothetical protein